MIVESSNTLEDSVFKANNIIDEILKMISSSDDSNNFININNFFDNWSSYISTMNSIQLCAISHILVSLCILFLLWNILVAYFGNKLIIYFNIDEKWPRLKKFIELRRKFQDYYIKFNSLFIIMLLIYITYIDLLLLYNNIKN